jgi:hypothetical protein
MWPPRPQLLHRPHTPPPAAVAAAAGTLHALSRLLVLALPCYTQFLQNTHTHTQKEKTQQHREEGGKLKTISTRKKISTGTGA